MELSAEKRLELEHEALVLLEKLVQINTHHSNPPGIRSAQRLLESLLTELGLMVERREPGRWTHLVAKTKAAGRPVLLLGHVDTVYPPDSDFRHFTVDHRIVRGPGVFDMKGGLVMVITALKLLHSERLLARIPLTVIFNADEEITSIESSPIIAEECLNARAALVFEFSRDGRMVITRRKGIRCYRAKVTGQATHAGDRHREGRSAILRLARYVVELEKLTDYERELSCNVGLISGGTAANIRPEYAEALFEVRGTRQDDFVELDRRLRKLAGSEELDGTSIEIEEESFRPPMEEQPGVKEVLDAYVAAGAKAGLALQPQLRVDGGGSDANITSCAGVPSLCGIGPTGGNPHSDGEYMEVDTLIPRSLAIYWYLKNSLTIQDPSRG